MTRIKTVRERTSVPSQLAGIVAVVVPPLGLLAATWLLWDRGVRPVDLDISALVIRGTEKLHLATEVKRPDSKADTAPASRGRMTPLQGHCAPAASGWQRTSA